MNTLALRSVQSNGSADQGANNPCSYAEVNVVYRIMNDNTMEDTVSVDQNTETYAGSQE